MNIQFEELHCSHKNSLEQYFSHGETDFYLCKKCGIVFRQPMPTLEELDIIYTDLYEDSKISLSTTNQESGSFALKKYSEFLLSKIIRPNTKVLDYGCGSGELVEMLRNSGVTITGLERSDEARKFGLINRNLVILSNIEDVLQNSLDTVIMIEVIEHLTDPNKTLSDIRSRLQPGGQVFITTPNRRGFRALLEGGKWREAKKKFHVVLFDKKSLIKTLKTAGYSDVKVVYYSPVQRPGFKAWLIVRLLQLLRISGTICVKARA